MKHSIFGVFLIIALTIASTLPAQERQDNQRNKSEYSKQKKNKDKNNSDTMSNRRMHDYHAPNGVDTPPMHRQQPPVPVPDSINHNMH